MSNATRGRRGLAGELLAGFGLALRRPSGFGLMAPEAVFVGPANLKEVATLICTLAAGVSKSATLESNSFPAPESVVRELGRDGELFTRLTFNRSGSEELRRNLMLIMRFTRIYTELSTDCFGCLTADGHTKSKLFWLRVWSWCPHMYMIVLLTFPAYCLAPW
jgi:hypothetical protein